MTLLLLLACTPPVAPTWQLPAEPAPLPDLPSLAAPPALPGADPGATVTRELQMRYRWGPDVAIGAPATPPTPRK